MSGQGSVADHPVAENIGLHHDVWLPLFLFRAFRHAAPILSALFQRQHLHNSSTLTSTNVWSRVSCCGTSNPSLASRCTSLEEVSMFLDEDMNASFEAFTSNVSRCACKPSWSIARICFAAALWIKVAGVPARCTSRNLHCVVHALFSNRLPAFIKPDLVVRQRESLHACWVSHRARTSHEVHIRFCSGLPSESSLMRSEISEKRYLHSFQPFKYIFRKTLGLSH